MKLFFGLQVLRTGRRLQPGHVITLFLLLVGGKTTILTRGQALQTHNPEKLRDCIWISRAK
jgi:hypothetical protein